MWGWPPVSPSAEKFLSCSQALKVTGNSARSPLVGSSLHPTSPPQLQQHRFKNTLPHSTKGRDYYFWVVQSRNFDSWFQMLTCLGNEYVYFFSPFLEVSVSGWLPSSQKVHSVRSCLRTDTHPKAARIQRERRAGDRNTPFQVTPSDPPPARSQLQTAHSAGDLIKGWKHWWPDHLSDPGDFREHVGKADIPHITVQSVSFLCFSRESQVSGSGKAAQAFWWYQFEPSQVCLAPSISEYKAKSLFIRLKSAVPSGVPSPVLASKLCLAFLGTTLSGNCLPCLVPALFKKQE